MGDWQYGTGAPDEQYLRLMALLIPGRELLSRRYDPLALFPLDPAKNGDYVVERKQLWALVDSPGNHIVYSQVGAGKTTFCRIADYSPPDGVFVVYLAPTAADLQQRYPFSGDRTALLQSIMAAFWNRTAGGDFSFYESRNPDPAWPRLLCWCFRRFPPQADGIQASLDQECRSEDLHHSRNGLLDVIHLVTEYRTRRLSDEDQALREEIVRLFSIEDLHKLCDDMGVEFEDIPNHNREKSALARELIAYFVRRSEKDRLLDNLRRIRPNGNWNRGMRLGQSGGRCYDHIRLLIESPRKASPEQQCQLVDDALRLSLNYQRLYVTLLINDDAEAVVHRWNANHPAHTQVLPLLDWTPAELQRLLWLRLRPSEYPQDSAPPHDPLLNLRVPLSKSAKEQSLSIIAEHAVRAKKDGEAASVHALRLARLLLTECAQRWANSETARPLGPGDLSSLCNRYWEERAQMEKEERYA